MKFNFDIAQVITLLFRGTQGVSAYIFLLVILSAIGRIISNRRAKEARKSGIRIVDGVFILLSVGIFFLLQNKIDMISFDLNNQTFFN